MDRYHPQQTTSIEASEIKDIGERARLAAGQHRPVTDLARLRRGLSHMLHPIGRKGTAACLCTVTTHSRTCTSSPSSRKDLGSPGPSTLPKGIWPVIRHVPGMSNLFRTSSIDG